MSDTDTPAVFDLDALHIEATSTPFPFRLGGQEFVLPAGEEADWRHVAALDRGDLEEGFRGLLGDKDFARFTSHKLSSGRLGKLLEAYLKHQGTGRGESPASTDS